MSVQIPDSLGSDIIVPDSTTKKSKKRKLETPEKERSSSKKRKHAEEEAATAVEATPARSSEKNKKKSSKHSELSSHTLMNGTAVEDAELTEGQNIADAESIPDIRSEKKKKKKRSKEKASIEEPTTNGVSTTSDIELPDAPVLDDNEPLPEQDTGVVQDAGTAAQVGKNSTEYPFNVKFLESAEPSCFYSTRLSLHLSIPAIALSTATNSILSIHLAPLLLTYYPPARGIVLAYADPVLSAKPDYGVCLPLRPPINGDIPDPIPTEVLSRPADEFGACWVWLTVTLLVFRPDRGDKIYGWTNVVSNGFVGVLGYNYFQISVGKSRIPNTWTWNGPAREQRRRGRKGRLRDASGNFDSQGSTAVEDEAEPGSSNPALQLSGGAGYFSDELGKKVPEVFEVKITDIDMVPDRDKWMLNIDGSLLDDEAEQKVLAEEREKFERMQNSGRSRTPASPGTDIGTEIEMSGGLAESRAGSAVVDSPE